MTTVLGIETSCDETAAAVVDDGRIVRSNVIASQVDLHARYGGVVPEIASRAHIERLDAVILEALERAGLIHSPIAPHQAGSPLNQNTERREQEGTEETEGLEHKKATETGESLKTESPPFPLFPPVQDPGVWHPAADRIDCIAVTHRPGLIGSLLIGVTAAKTLSWAWTKPLVAVDHILAHAVSAAIDVDPPPWPAVGLIVSGGHTVLFHIRSFDDIRKLGATTDDAAGEAFDKVATILGLPYPGGPHIDRLAAKGDPNRVTFPRAMLEPDSLDFSFSGIKTAVLYHVHGTPPKPPLKKGGKTGAKPPLAKGGQGGVVPKHLSEQDIADIAASFQQAMVDVLVAKTLRAVDRTGVRAVVLGGGVAANRALRAALSDTCASRGLAFHAAAMPYCMDNAAMIAALGYHQFRRGEFADPDLTASAS